MTLRISLTVVNNLKEVSWLSVQCRFETKYVLTNALWFDAARKLSLDPMVNPFPSNLL